MWILVKLREQQQQNWTRTSPSDSKTLNQRKRCVREWSKKRRVAATVCDCDCYCCYRINATYILERDDMVRISGVFKKRFAQEKSMKHCLSLSQRDLTRFKMLNGCQSVRVCALLHTHTHITQTDINLYRRNAHHSTSLHPIWSVQKFSMFYLLSSNRELTSPTVAFPWN